MGVHQEIKLKLCAFDHRVLDQAVRDIVRIVRMTGAKIKGAIPLPGKNEWFIVNRSGHIDKESREQFVVKNHYRLLYIETSPQTIDALMKLDLPSGVEVQIKLKGAE